MAENIITKQCSKCKQVKPVSEFRIRPNRPMGYESQCRQCRKKYFQKYRQSDKGQRVQKKYKQSKKARDSQKRYFQTEIGKRKMAMAIKNHKLRHPERAKARNIISNATTHHGFPKASKYSCYNCKKRKASQYHHPDYYKPFFVIPLCYKCHLKIHSQKIGRAVS